jgi:hypothetical protein
LVDVTRHQADAGVVEVGDAHLEGDGLADQHARLVAGDVENDTVASAARRVLRRLRRDSAEHPNVDGQDCT